MLKSVGAVLGSYVVSVVLVLATDPLLSALFPGNFVRGRVPSTTALITSTALFILISIFCAGLCARLVPAQAKRNVLCFFVLGEAMGIATTIPQWSKGMPHWYFLSWLVSWPVSCWVGLRLANRRAAKTTAASA
jgi:hypothetical protein